MSRFTKIIDNNEFAWGFDEPLGEFFFHKEDLATGKLEFGISNFVSIKPLERDGTNRSSYSNGQIARAMVQEMGDEAPQDFLEQLKSGIPWNA